MSTTTIARWTERFTSMDKIASSVELQAELQRILTAVQQPNPSRSSIAEELRVLAARVSPSKGVKFTEKGDKWLARVEYAREGEKYEWQISEDDGDFSVQVKTPKGSFKRNKTFDSLAQAERYANRFINVANGDELLKDVLSKDFTKV